jgi:hypothetical protein
MSKGKRAGGPAPGVKKADFKAVAGVGFREALVGRQSPDSKKKANEKAEHEAAQVARDKALGKSPLTGEPMKMVTAPDKGWPNKEDAQGFLFGEADKIRTALSSELVIINAEIDSAEKSQVSIENRIDSLEARRRVVEDAMKSIDKVKDEKFPIAKKKK